MSRSLGSRILRVPCSCNQSTGLILLRTAILASSNRTLSTLSRTPTYTCTDTHGHTHTYTDACARAHTQNMNTRACIHTKCLRICVWVCVCVKSQMSNAAHCSKAIWPSMWQKLNPQEGNNSVRQEQAPTRYEAQQKVCSQLHFFVINTSAEFQARGVWYTSVLPELAFSYAHGHGNGPSQAQSNSAKGRAEVALCVWGGAPQNDIWNNERIEGVLTPRFLPSPQHLVHSCRSQSRNI
jgi:hypothetical protein